VANVVLDEDVHKSLAERLRDAGHTVERVVEVGLSSAEDLVIFGYAQQRQLVLITGDLGFVNARTITTEHWGVILLRYPNEMRTEAINAEVMDFINNEIPLGDLHGRLVVLEPGGRARIRESER